MNKILLQFVQFLCSRLFVWSKTKIQSSGKHLARTWALEAKNLKYRPWHGYKDNVCCHHEPKNAGQSVFFPILGARTLIEAKSNPYSTSRLKAYFTPFPAKVRANLRC